MFKKLAGIILAVCLVGALPALAADGTAMKTSEAGIKFIKSYEGYSDTVYADASGYAIGYGTHINPADFPGVITESQADWLLRDVVSGMEDKVNAMLDSFGVTVTQYQFDALVSLTYNLGSGWMTSNYRLYNMLRSGIQYYDDDTIVNTFGRYCHSGSQVLDILAWRRLAEAKLFLYGDYKTGGTQNYTYELLTDDPDTDIRFNAEGGLTTGRFSDVAYTDWYYAYVSPLAYTGTVSGYGDGTFRPQNAVTCGEALKLLLTAAGCATQTAASGEHWAQGYLDYAVSRGIVSADEITDLDAPADRLLVAHIAAGALGLSASGKTPFADVDDTAVTALYERGIVQGRGTGAGGLLYAPDASLLRGELCALAFRIENSR